MSGLIKGRMMLRSASRKMSRTEVDTLVTMIHSEAVAAAKDAVVAFRALHGEPLYCGFAWVQCFAKGNTKLGKSLMRESIGFSKDYRGGISIWDPSSSMSQSMDLKEAGARAYAEVFVKHGITAYMGSRAD